MIGARPTHAFLYVTPLYQVDSSEFMQYLISLVARASEVVHFASDV